MDKEERQQLFNYAALGREVDDFMHSTIGRYLLLRSDTEYAAALTKLSVCDAFDEAGVLKLQSDAKRAKDFREWLAEAINTGLTAESELQGRNDEVPE